MTLTITQVNLPQSKYAIKCPFVMDPDGITMHNTANDASAMAEISYMQGNPHEVSFHYAVDDVRAVQGLDLNRNGWHAGDGGSGKGNRTTIGVEICYSKSGGASFTKAERNAAELVARILKSKGWGINKVGKHQDYWQGTYYKYCPHRTLDLGWQRFLNMVQIELNKLNGTSTVTPPKAEVKPTTPTPKPVTPKYKEDPFNVRQVTDDVLRVRKEPNTKSAIIKVLPKGKEFTPTKIVRNGESVEGYTTWCNTEGGWVSMAYTTPAKATTPTKPVAKPAPAKKYVTLPASAKQWGIYRQGVQPVSKNIFAYLAPSKFGGLTYEIKGWTVANQVALIDTQDFGRVQIYVAKGTGAVIK
jgi:N-acetylmuramoyl-L-alanine amidase